MTLISIPLPLICSRWLGTREQRRGREEEEEEKDAEKHSAPFPRASGFGSEMASGGDG